MLNFLEEQLSDGTKHYKVIPDTPCNVKELVDAILSERPEDSGSIEINLQDSFRGKSVYRYRKGTLHSKMSHEILDRPVVLAKAAGLLKRMDYTIVITSS